MLLLPRTPIDIIAFIAYLWTWKVVVMEKVSSFRQINSDSYNFNSFCTQLFTPSKQEHLNSKNLKSISRATSVSRNSLDCTYSWKNIDFKANLNSTYDKKSLFIKDHVLVDFVAFVDSWTEKKLFFCFNGVFLRLTIPIFFGRFDFLSFIWSHDMRKKSKNSISLFLKRTEKFLSKNRLIECQS